MKTNHTLGVKIPRGQTPKRAAYMKNYNATHPKRDRRAYKAAYDKAHTIENKAYRARNVEKLKARKKAYYQANRERLLAYAKKRAKENSVRISEYQAMYYEANAEYVKGRVARYRARYPEKKTTLESRRRAQKRGNGGSHTTIQRIEKFKALGNVCFYCGLAGELTIDHALPISRGGTDNIENILPACRSCNSKKNMKTMEEFIVVRAKPLDFF